MQFLFSVSIHHKFNIIMFKNSIFKMHKAENSVLHFHKLARSLLRISCMETLQQGVKFLQNSSKFFKTCISISFCHPMSLNDIYCHKMSCHVMAYKDMSDSTLVTFDQTPTRLKNKTKLLI